MAGSPSPNTAGVPSSAQVVPLRAGFGFAAGGSPRKSKPAVVSRRASAAVLLAANLMRAADNIAWNATLALSGYEPESIHQLRITLRRLRAIISFSRKFVPQEHMARLRDLVRKANAALGPARDADVLIAEVLEPAAKAMAEDSDLARLVEAAGTERRARWEAARESIRSLEFTYLLDAIRGLARELRAGGALHQIPAVAFAKHALKRRYKKLRDAGQHVRRMNQAERHRLRIALKKQRYAAEIFACLFGGKKRGRYVKALARVQGALGILNDMAGAPAQLESLAAAAAGNAALARATGLVLGFHAAGAAARERDLRKAWKRLKSVATFWYGR
jgi:triphosphatase